MEDLKSKNLLLSNEKHEYEITIRSLEKRLKIFSLIKNYWWLIASAFALGITLAKYL